MTSALHSFPDDIRFELPETFTDPFRYTPHESVRIASEYLIKHIESDKKLAEAFSEGKMLGVLVCTKPSEPEIPYYLAAFSGNVGGNSMIEGFVPPIYDLTNPNGEFKQREAEISQINLQIKEFLEDSTYIALIVQLEDAQKQRDKELENMKAAMAASKSEREKMRKDCIDEMQQASLVRQSQFEKAEFRRLKSSWEEKIARLNILKTEYTDKIDLLRRQRASMSEALQAWIFRQYRVHNSLGEHSSIKDIFESQGLTPPGGTGECAAPKLLEYAYRNSLKPLAMGEFWYGKSSGTAVRTHGRFYPSCTSKCGPLLGYMLGGLNNPRSCSSIACANLRSDITPIIIYEDEAIIVVEKPSGMPSVPGLDGRISLNEWLTNKATAEGRCPDNAIHAVHRLDMDTSGVMIFAKTHQAAVDLRKQFENHTIRKSYKARLCPPLKCSSSHLSAGDKGSITLPMAPDYDERPRQKVDMTQGKPAHTDYEVISVNADGSLEVILYPQTGRTHQLRVHCAHNLGLECPIAGDMLYGGHYVNICKPCTTTAIKTTTSQHTERRLCLHAFSITFRHPSTGEQLTISASETAF